MEGHMVKLRKAGGPRAVREHLVDAWESRRDYQINSWQTAFYKALADSLHEGVELRREDVFINLIEVPKENWSFGNGEAQYVPTLQ